MLGDRFVDDEELIGKTITKVRLHQSSVDILFTDGTYTYVYYGGGWYLGDQEISFEALGTDELRMLDEQKDRFENAGPS